MAEEDPVRHAGADFGHEALAARFAFFASGVEAVETQLLRTDLVARMFGEPRDPVSVGRFEVTRELGAGGMGQVYLARDPDLRRDVAIKLLHGTASAHRLVREARSMARISHPNVVQIFDVGALDRDRLFIAMELVLGTTLGVWLETPRSNVSILAVFLRAGEGLMAAHRAGILHRDFKPCNVLISDDGDVKVTDFGLASSEPAKAAPSVQASGLSDTLTAAGTVLGTPAYMAPEQREGEKVGEAADQFAFCVALCEALYGERPRAAAGAEALAEQVASIGERQPAPERPRFSAIARGLRWDQDERWPALCSLLTELAPPKPRRGWARPAAISLVLFGALAAATVSGVSGAGGASGAGAHAGPLAEAAGEPPKAPSASAAWTEADRLARDGRLQEAIAANEVERATTDGTGDAWARSSAWIQAGKLCVLDGRNLDAADALRKAFEIATRAGLDAPRAEAAARLVFVAGYLNRDPEEGRKWARHAEAALPRLSEPNLVAARVHRNLGLLFNTQGRPSEALPRYERALALRLEALGPVHPDVAEVYGNLGSHAFGLRDYARAKRFYRKALRIYEDSLGPDHVWVALALNDLGSAELRLGDPEAAQRRFARGLEIRKKLRPGHPHLTTAWTSLGWAALEAGDLPTAERHYREALEVTVAANGEAHPRSARALADLAVVLREDRRPHEALQLFNRALVANETALGADHRQTVRCRETVREIREEIAAG